MTSAATPTPDHVLLGAFLRDGDRAALRRLVERLTPALFRVARGLTAWRVLGAQTVVERAWQVALRRGGEVELDDRGLLCLLLREVIERAGAMGDSPQPSLAAEADRAEAMRAVALLPTPSRTIYVLHDVGGLPSSWVAELLRLPLARVVAELWHARLAVETLRGTAAEPLAPEGTDEPAAVLDGVAPIWLEAPPAELLDRVCEHAVHRRATLLSRPLRMGRRLDLPTALLVASLALLGATAYQWRTPGTGASVAGAPASPAPVLLPGGVVTARPDAAPSPSPKAVAKAKSLRKPARADSARPARRTALAPAASTTPTPAERAVAASPAERDSSVSQRGGQSG